MLLSLSLPSQTLIPEVDGKVDGIFQYLPPSAIPEEIGGSYPFDLEKWTRTIQK